MTKIIALTAVVGALVFPACDSLGQAMTAHTDVVARAAGHELTIEETAQLLAENPQLPAQTEVVDAVANLWIDYILLATAVAADSTLADLDLQALIAADADQMVVFKLQEQVIQPDTVFTEEEIQQLYEQEAPGAQVRARHILLSVPPDASPAQRDSVRSLLESIRERVLAGEDFGALASEYSEDQSNAPQGGDLGFFGKGQMVAPFEEAAFALDEGEVSGIVETAFGYHLIKVEERRSPALEDLRNDFLLQLKSRRIAEAEDAYIQELLETRSLTVQPDAMEVVRELAQNPTVQLSGRAAARPLVRYEGGALTAADMLTQIQRMNPRQRAGLAAATDEQLETALEEVFARSQILIEQARAEGLDLGPEERDSLVAEARRQVRSITNFAGLGDLQVQEGESQTEAVERRVMEVMGALVRGERSVPNLGPLPFALREEYSTDVNPRTFPEVVQRVEEIRPAQQTQPTVPGMPQQGPAPNAPRPQGQPQPGQPGQPQPGQ